MLKAALTLEQMPKVITFDCYGTLVQWHAAMLDVARAIIFVHPEVIIAEERTAMLADDIRARAVAHQQREPYRTYGSVLRASLSEALAAVGAVATEEDYWTLWSTLSRIAPHPDARAALARLRSRYRLAIISNTDDELIAGTVAAIDVPIDFVITAQQARAYKPDHRLFEYAHATMGVTKDETIHVGMGQFTDLKACHELGIRSVWIDREGEPLNPDWPPSAVLPDLTALPDLLLVSRARATVRPH